MRVIVVGPDWVDSFEMGCVRGLRALGHEADVCDLRQHMGVPRPLRRFPMAYLVADYLLRGLVREPYALAQRALLDKVRRFGADMVLVVQLLWVLPETITTLREQGVRCVGWFPDAFTSFGRGTFLLAPWDALFFQDPFIVERLRTSLSAHHIHHLPQCCDPTCHRTVPLSDEDRARYQADVATFGNYYPYRAKLLEPLLTGDITVRLWGARPPRWLHHKVRDHWAGRVVLGDDKCRAMLAAKIALNTNHYAGIGDVNKRTFELCGIGAFQLTDERAALGHYFEIGDEVATFTGRGDLRDKVDHYLAHPEERLRIAKNGQIRAHRDHTFENRLRRMLETLPSGAAPG